MRRIGILTLAAGVLTGMAVLVAGCEKERGAGPEAAKTKAPAQKAKPAEPAPKPKPPEKAKPAKPAPKPKPAVKPKPAPKAKPAAKPKPAEAPGKAKPAKPAPTPKKIAAIKISQKTCPVSDDPIDPNIVTVHKGRKIYFCCKECIAKFKKDPAKYLAKLDKKK